MSTTEQIPMPDGSSLRVHLSVPIDTVPAGTAPARPGVVVLHEVFGPAPDMHRVADRFAARGWVAVLPDLFSRGNRVGCLARAMTELVRGRPGPVTAEVAATHAWLAGRTDTDADRLAVIGFCMGGGFALLFAAGRPPGLRAASVNYGPTPAQAQSLRGICPVVGAYGSADLPNRKHAARLEAHLSTLGIEHDVVIHEGVGHSFMTDGHRPVLERIALPMRVGYDPEAAEAAWARTFAFLDRHVGHGTTQRSPTS